MYKNCMVTKPSAYRGSSWNIAPINPYIGARGRAGRAGQGSRAGQAGGRHGACGMGGRVLGWLLRAVRRQPGAGLGWAGRGELSPDRPAAGPLRLSGARTAHKGSGCGWAVDAFASIRTKENNCIARVVWTSSQFAGTQVRYHEFELFWFPDLPIIGNMVRKSGVTPLWLHNPPQDEEKLEDILKT
ncbi:hypothetical protein BDZ91DRAFT_765705 [Kalaharituber pfeilii]|nr:hypothetical protein BDZ91DRAFT_765705 [Kalaharituber pfeilii]